MRYYFLIMIWLVAGAGCAVPEKMDSLAMPNSSEAGAPNDNNDFGLFEGELAEQVVKVADPIESVNRVMFGFNDVLYFWVVKPVARVYADAVSKPIRLSIDRFFNNVTTPVRAVNCLLQGKNKAACRELHRFAVNTTAGVLGFGDPAHDKLGLDVADEDLGQTLAVHGIGDGFYIVLPWFGPSTLRDTAGIVGDQFLNPVRYVKPASVSIGISAFDSINEASFRIGEYEAFKAAAVDPYIAMRNTYIQYRKSQIEDKSEPKSIDANSLTP